MQNIRLLKSERKRHFLTELSKHALIFSMWYSDNYGHIGIVSLQNKELWSGVRYRSHRLSDNSLIHGRNVLEFVADIKKALREINRILKPDGISSRFVYGEQVTRRSIVLIC